MVAILLAPCSAQESASTAPATLDAASLSFSFERAPWRDVIKWIADECGLALQYEELPTGSFSYSDSNAFSQQEAIDRVNLFLLPQGYTLVRSGRLLSVINLGDPRSMQQLDALAPLKTPEDLSSMGSQEVVKCIFPLGELLAEDAVEELAALKLMTQPAVFNKTNQLMITDTTANLLSVKAILDAFQPKGMDNGTVMKSFALQHATAEDILLVARPHLGLATGEMIGIDVSLSADLQGKNIFVTGVEDRVKLIENLILALDQPSADVPNSAGVAELRSYLVKSGNVDMVYDVLQTLLSGKSLRLSKDESTSSIVALASADVQNEIAATVQQMQAVEADFEVIPLKTIDPYFAISLLEEMLDLPSSYADPDDIPPDTPKIDADPGSMRLFVRAKPHQIEQIKKIIAGLDIVGATQEHDLRVLPLRGDEAEAALKSAAKFWRRENPIVLYPAIQKAESKATERVVGEVAQANTPSSSKFVSSMGKQANDRDASPIYLTDNIRSQAPLIRCQMTSNGLVLQSDDAEALSEFEQLLRSFGSPGVSATSPPTVFYLQYTRPAEALRLLAELLDGRESAKEAEADTLVNGYVSSSGSYLGSLVTSRDGTITMMFDTITIVADPRLNRLIAQGTADDIEMIEDYLAIIDKGSSIADIQTYGTSHVIELAHTSAMEVASVLRETYSGRIVQGSENTSAATGGRPAAPAPVARPPKEENPRDAEEKKLAAKNSANAAARDLEPKMTIAVHEASNSLIVTAPEQLFLEVEKLAKLIDMRSEQTVEIIAPGNSAVLQAIFQPDNGRPSTRGNSGSGSNRNDRGSDTQSRVLELLKRRGSSN
jgi:type II secretory pathway component GspD/PulD (secretin)